MSPSAVKPLVLLGTTAALCLFMQSLTPDNQVNPITQLLLVVVALVCTLTGNDAQGQGSVLERSGAFHRTPVPVTVAKTPDGLRETDTFAGAMVIPPTARCPTYGGRRKSLDPFDIRAPTCSPSKSGGAPQKVPKAKLPAGFRESDTFAGCVAIMPTALCPTYATEAVAPVKTVSVSISAPAAASPLHVPVTQGNPDSFEGIKMQGPPTSCPAYETGAPSLVSPIAQSVVVASDSPSGSPSSARTLTMPVMTLRTSVAPVGSSPLAVGRQVKPSPTGAALKHILDLLPPGQTGEIVGFNRVGDPQVRVRGRTVALSAANICAA